MPRMIVLVMILTGLSE